jgi:Na+/H+ antiporter NhaA
MQKNKKKFVIDKDTVKEISNTLQAFLLTISMTIVQDLVVCAICAEMYVHSVSATYYTILIRACCLQTIKKRGKEKMTVYYLIIAGYGGGGQ